MKNTFKLVLMPALVLLCVSNTLGQLKAEQPVEFKKISDRLFEIVGGRGAQGEHILAMTACS
jgi:hypothetical protein